MSHRAVQTDIEVQARARLETMTMQELREEVAARHMLDSGHNRKERYIQQLIQHEIDAARAARSASRTLSALLRLTLPNPLIPHRPQ